LIIFLLFIHQVHKKITRQFTVNAEEKLKRGK